MTKFLTIWARLEEAGALAGPGASRNRLNPTAEVEAAADAINFAVNTVGPRKYEEELGAEEEEEKPGTGCFERASLGLVAGSGTEAEADAEGVAPAAAGRLARVEGRAGSRPGGRAGAESLSTI